MQTKDFKLDGIAISLRYHFIQMLSDYSQANGWSSKFKEFTNSEQNAYFFSQTVSLKPGVCIECVYENIQTTLLSLNEKFNFEFDVNWIEKGYQLEITNIKNKEGK